MEKERLFSIQWLDSIENEGIFKRAMMARDDWAYEHLNLKPVIDYNEYGDANLFSTEELIDVSEEKSFVTYYDDIPLNIAYVRCKFHDNHILDQVAEKIKYYLKTENLNDGSIIEELVLITTTRERAVAINTQARRLGCYKVFYLDDYRNLWDLCPEGNWREPCPYDVDVVEVKI